MRINPTHQSFEEMAEAIFKAAKDDDFPGIVPWDNPESMLFGYVKALPKSKRTVDDQWCCRIDLCGAVNSDTKRRLQSLVKLPNK